MRHIITSLLSMLVFTATAETTAIRMGSQHINGERIASYQYTWRQCARQEDAWTDQGNITEQAQVIGDLLRIRQVTQRPDGGQSKVTHYLKRGSLSPLRSEVTHYTPDGQTAAEMVHELDDKGYHSLIQQGHQRKTQQGEINTGMFNGVILGLPVALIEPSLYPVKLPASMLVFDAVYDVILTDAGTATLDFDGRPVETRMIDVEWHHLGQGDIYPPGPDASGGRYWVTADPPDGFPYVARYKTDTYAVEFIADTCR